MSDLNWYIITYSWTALAVVTFIVLYFFRVKPAYGRHSRMDWGPMINNSLGWFLMEIPSLICIWTTFLWFRTESTPLIAWFPMVLWTLHYVNRSVIFPMRMRDRSKQMPAVIAVSSVVFNLFNGTLNGVFLAKGWFAVYPLLISIGTIVFFTGMYINMRSDHILLNLRRPGESGYKLPRGFLFGRVTSPNLLGEIVEWFGFFLLAPGPASLSFLVWTLANLVPRARDHYEWYLEKFPEFPKERKILFPGIW